MDVPAFHPEWLVTFWLTTPVLNRIEPHLFSLLLIIALFVAYYVRRKKKPIAKVDSEEEQFQLLLTRRKLLEQELKELGQEDEVNHPHDEQFIKKKQELEKHLSLTNEKLQQFTSLTK